MKELQEINDQVELNKGNQQMYLILILWLLLGGLPLVIYKAHYEKTPLQTTSIQKSSIKNPEAVTSR